MPLPITIHMETMVITPGDLIWALETAGIGI